MPSPSEKRKFKTKQELVYEALRAEILHAELAPGTRLVIDELARRFDVSAIPVREALSQLQAEGLVDVRPHAGATVAGFSAESVAELFAVMEALEALAADAAVAHASAADIASLMSLIERMAKARKGSERERWADLNQEFHLAICRIARLPTVLELTERVLDQWARLRRIAFRNQALPDLDAAEHEHRAMTAALAARDATALRAVVAAHNRSAAKHYHATPGV
jgi:DNA-binding GntR family transcriptional regulator